MQNEISTPYFNSIKVRLEPNSFAIKVGIDPFQFHKGTIRTPFPDDAVHQERVFQFHKGTIRTGLQGGSAKRAFQFQFHKGTIRTAAGASDRAHFGISIP